MKIDLNDVVFFLGVGLMVFGTWFEVSPYASAVIGGGAIALAAYRRA